MTCATSVAVPFADKTLVGEVNVIEEPAGAKSGDRSHDITVERQKAAAQTTAVRRPQRVSIIVPNILNAMQLAGQDEHRCPAIPRHCSASKDDAGYAMAVLLVGMAITAVLMTVAMPVWKQSATREKEAELLFRGRQYVRAIGLFQRRNGPGVLPPSTQVLIDQHYLRKKFIDPITGSPFLVLPGAAPAQGATTQINTNTALGGPNTAGTSPAAGGGSTTATGGATGGRGTTGSSAAGPVGAMEEPKLGNVPGGIAGVVSKSGDTSLFVFNGRTHYNEWEFRYIPPAPQPGQNPGGDGRGAQGERGQPPPGGPGDRGRGADGFGARGRGPGAPPGGRALPPGGSPPDRPAGPFPGATQPNPRGGSPFTPPPQRGR
jgi:type II secretory pathway pseudopilin PulG